MRVLVTGGAGFVGSHVADRLAADGHEPLVLDALLPQAHGDGPPAGVRRLVLAGSMVVYGEGRYDCRSTAWCGPAPERLRTSTPAGTSRAARAAARTWFPGWSARTRR